MGRAVSRTEGARREMMGRSESLDEQRRRKRFVRLAFSFAIFVILGVLAIYFGSGVLGAILGIWAALPVWVRAPLVAAGIAVLGLFISWRLRWLYAEHRERLDLVDYPDHRAGGIGGGGGALAYFNGIDEHLASAFESEPTIGLGRWTLLVNPHQSPGTWDHARRPEGNVLSLGCNDAEGSFEAALRDKEVLVDEVAGVLDEMRALGDDHRQIHAFVGVGTQPNRSHTGISTFEALLPEVLERFPTDFLLVDLMTQEVRPPAQPSSGDGGAADPTPGSPDSMANPAPTNGGTPAREETEAPGLSPLDHLNGPGSLREEASRALRREREGAPGRGFP